MGIKKKEKVDLNKVITQLGHEEKNENPKEKIVCNNCGNDTFKVYITTVIDDARLYCTKCGKDPEN